MNRQAKTALTGHPRHSTDRRQAAGAWCALCGAAALALALPPAAARAQDTPGQATEQSATVMKGKAPVNKKLLVVRFPKPKSFTLSNGLTVYVLEDHRFPAVRMRLIMHAGSLFEPKPGVAEMTAAMLTEGTKSRTASALAEETANMGASLTAASGLDTATLSVAGLSETTDDLIGLMSDVLLYPSFDGERLARMKQRQSAGIQQRRANPAALTADLASKVYYGGTPYGKPSAKEAEIASIATDDLRSFHDALYRPNGAILGVSGDVDTRALKAKLEKALAAWKAGPQTPELPKADFKAHEETRIFLVDRPGSAQTVLQFGNLAITQSDPDYIPLVVANRILGGGSSGRLFQNIREQKGYTYGAYSQLSAGRWPGIWGASASVRTPVTEPAVREFFREFDRLQDTPISAVDLERAKRSIIGSFATTLESPDAILNRTLELVQNGLPLDYWDTYPARVQAVTADDVQRVAKKYLGKNRIQLIAIGERSKIEDGLKKFGPVEVVDASQLGGGVGRGGGRRR
ncbi:MAG TPA: pitrilysin family protein [Chthonomonadaceae bacterium]|nr:pitrilysin family protein [Chthonomonadaceae bacterium]